MGTFYKSVILFLFLLILLPATYALAADPIKSSTCASVTTNDLVCNPAPKLFSTKFCGTDGCTFKEILNNIIDLMLGLSGTIAMLYIIIGGYQYITSAGNPALAEKGKKTLTNAIIGLVIIILSYVIVKLVVLNLS